MKIKTIATILVGVLSLDLSSISLAEISHCDDPTSFVDVHCTYISGLSPKFDAYGNFEDGRYIKQYSEHDEMSRVSCRSSASSFYESEDMDSAEPGTYVTEYSICTDLFGTQCEPIGNDIYSIVKADDKLVSLPKSYSIDITKLKDRYPKCLVTV
jgi:hypothetical protein